MAGPENNNKSISSLMADKNNKMDEEIEQQKQPPHEDEKMEIGEEDEMIMKSQQQRPAESNSQPTKLNIADEGDQQRGEGKKGGCSIEQPSEPKAEPAAATLELEENNKQQKEKTTGGIGLATTSKTPINNNSSNTPMKSTGGSGAHLGTASQQIASMAAAASGGTPQSVAAAAAQSSTPNPATNPTATLPQYQVGQANVQAAFLASGSRYQQLMAMIDELGKDIRPTYNGNRACQERLKRSIVQARLMVRECQGELEKSRLEKEKAGGGQ